MKLQNNKHKQAKASDFDCIKNPGKFFKNRASRLLRREPIEEKEFRAKSKTDSRANRKKPGRCPICTSKLIKNSKGTRYVKECAVCKGAYKKSTICSSCSTNRVWSGPEGSFCQGCGNEN